MEQQARRYTSNGASTSNAASASTSAPNQSKSTLPLPQPRSGPDLHGRARKKAELNRLQQEIRLLKEDLEKVQTLPPASTVCHELIESIEGASDPLLVASGGPLSWDRWFMGPPAPKAKFCC